MTATLVKDLLDIMESATVGGILGEGHSWVNAQQESQVSSFSWLLLCTLRIGVKLHANFMKVHTLFVFASELCNIHRLSIGSTQLSVVYHGRRLPSLAQMKKMTLTTA